MISKPGVTNWPALALSRGSSKALLANLSWEADKRQFLFDYADDGSDADVPVFDPPLNPGPNIRRSNITVLCLLSLNVAIEKLYWLIRLVMTILSMDHVIVLNVLLAS
jgi:hypothetical protein